jgi:multidrug transporter EmrE-like cation transporter
MGHKSILILAVVVLNSSAHILLKYNAAKNGSIKEISASNIIDKYFQVYFILAVLLFGLSVIAYNHALTKFNLSFAYPLFNSLTYVLVILSSLFIFNETLSMLQIAGIIVIIIGVWMITA